MISFVIQHHPHGTLAHLRGKLVRRFARHGSILFGSWSLRQTRGGSLTVFKSDKDLFSNVFKEAEKLARSVDGGGRRVAVLCASAEQFDIYVRAASGQYKDRHIAITSREPSSELRHAGKRFILSMPEYVAGLQFETVFLIHVDAAEAPIDAGDGIRRRFISNIYLGSSRAEQTLKISAATTHGGKSDVLDMALARHSLREVAPPRESKPAQKKG